MPSTCYSAVPTVIVIQTAILHKSGFKRLENTSAASKKPFKEQYPICNYVLASA